MKDTKGYAVIYMFTSPSGKSYIGQSVNFQQRYNKYKRNESKSIGRHFHSAIKKYNGIENFELTILCKFEIFEDIVEVKKKLDLEETFYIEKYNTLEEGYNLTAGGGGSFKREVTQETRDKLSEANKGKNTKPKVNLKCNICNKEFSLKQSIYRRRFRVSKTISCSRDCKNKAGRKSFQLVS